MTKVNDNKRNNQTMEGLEINFAHKLDVSFLILDLNNNYVDLYARNVNVDNDYWRETDLYDYPKTNKKLLTYGLIGNRPKDIT